jgi:hypothetical protein
MALGLSTGFSHNPCWVIADASIKLRVIHL